MVGIFVLESLGSSCPCHTEISKVFIFSLMNAQKHYGEGGEILGQHLRSTLHAYFVCSHENEVKNRSQKLKNAKLFSPFLRQMPE